MDLLPSAYLIVLQFSKALVMLQHLGTTTPLVLENTSKYFFLGEIIIAKYGMVNMNEFFISIIYSGKILQNFHLKFTILYLTFFIDTSNNVVLSLMISKLSF
ncbi:unnamed protein product [Protopolystoma xenopodis]|uniref:Uncharacterized protein n=1 Tax=Protopolystoma xenopodis TaxID=117903 RepID=A0A448XT94_9PLAT|nr:unnamed protein product [Protopolystoma xenopodis]